MTEIEVSDADFDEKVVEMSKKVPVVVDFWAPWCGPCRMLGPILEKLAEEYEDRMVLAKLNVDSSPQKAQEFGVRGIPNVKMFKEGRMAAEFVGARPEAVVKAWLEESL